MRALLIVFAFLLTGTLFSQNFVSPGIIAFHSGAYERTISDMNKAFETTPNMDSDMRSKAYYYRGMARLNLLKAGSGSSAIGRDPYLQVYNDLSNASSLDRQWRESVNKELSTIYSQLIRSAQSLYDEGIYASTEEEIDNLLGLALTKLNIAVQVNDNFESNSLLGQTHDAIAVFYDQLYDDPSAQKKALDAYQSAYEYYEAALEKQPRSLETVRALRQLSYRLGNREDELRYAQLEAEIGG